MPRWQIEIEHPGLKKSRVISGNDKFAVEQKAAQQRLVWHREWLAHLRTEQAKAEIRAVQTVLTEAIGPGLGLDWELVKRSDPFPEPPPEAPAKQELPPEPQRTDPDFNLSWWGIFTKTAAELASEREQLFLRAHADWLKLKLKIEAERGAYTDERDAWADRRNKFLESQAKRNEIIGEMRRAYELAKEEYEKGNRAGVSAVVEFVLLYHSLGGVANRKMALPCEHRVAFTAESGVLVVDYSLPLVNDLPNLKEVRYVASRDAFSEIKLRPNELDQLYDDLIYQICLKTLHLIFSFDTLPAVKAAVFNGWVTFADPATGVDRRACIISVQAERDAFMEINLERVDPRACFRALKGVGSAKLHGMVPIAPLVQGTREDSRFVESIEVADRIRVGTNLAAIGWEDFEHLVREIFEKEFKAGGGEVRVTRASRDWGVDAIAFDPDPIRGGKIVIQAKRYTNTVDVSAVRDLYGTVMNEGATKGILVTTSAFGPDAYAFAKGKPLTLFDGSYLLHLLERHGQRAYIDLAEAKRLNPTPLARTMSG